jgi:predicted regulator of Ras-like GTPase activity (Roadblock/LC7/MglB family)
VRKAGDSLQVGALEELAVRAQRLVLVCRMIAPTYFVAVVLSPEGNFGKARYLARMATPALVAQL